MYCKFFGFRERPFNVTSDPSFFFLSHKHKEALAHLSYGVAQRKGIILLTGEIGTGKTTLCRVFLRQMGSLTRTAFILNPLVSEQELLEAIMRDFGLRVIPGAVSGLGLLNEFNRFLLRESSRRRNVVLIIDESQTLSPQVLEYIRLLSNLETDKQKLLQIVLVGQPELNEHLELLHLRQLKQRVMVRFHITPLEQPEIAGYINYRLRIVGSQKVCFTDDAIEKISGFSSGTPRLINMLSDRALLAAFAAQTNVINADIISRCIEELTVDVFSHI